MSGGLAFVAAGWWEIMRTATRDHAVYTITNDDVYISLCSLRPMENESMDDIMTRIMNEYEPASHPTSQRAQRAFPRLKVRSLASASPDVGEASAAPGEVCTVCHDAFKPGDEVIELPCNHCFHEDCLLPWLQSHNTCPVCRLELPAEEASQASRGDQGQGASQSAGGGQRAGRPAQVYYAASGPGFSGGNEEGGVERSFGSTLAQLVSSVASQWLQAQNLEAGARPASVSRSGPSQGSGPSEQGTSRVPSQSASEMRARRSQASGAGSAAPEASSGSQRAGNQERPTGAPQGQSGQNEPSILGMVAGGILAGLAGTALGAFFGSGRRSAQR